jgi:hypothetical protein
LEKLMTSQISHLVSVIVAALAALLFYYNLASYECCHGEDGAARNLHRLLLFIGLPSLTLFSAHLLRATPLMLALKQNALLIVTLVAIRVALFPSHDTFVFAHATHENLRTAAAFALCLAGLLLTSRNHMPASRQT